jgi:iron(III) transport system permease protein
MTRCPGRGLFEWALLLPMAMPAYIIAYTYTGMLDFAGPLQTAIRDYTGWGYGEYWFPEIRSIGGAITMLTLVLYPYVYLLARTAFIDQSVCALEVSRTLGCTAWQSFRRVALPLARPAIIAGLSLVMMETLADYGTVKYFGISTFTTGIFRTWFGLNESAAAAQLAALLMVFVLTLLLLEKYSRKQQRFHQSTGQYRSLPGTPLSAKMAALAILVCSVPVLVGFLIPAAQLAAWAFTIGQESANDGLSELFLNSVALAIAAAVIALLLALLLGYTKRIHPFAWLRFSVSFSGLGYAIPGTVIAVGVMLPFAWLDNVVDAWMRANMGFSTGLILSGTLVALMFAYQVRFLAVSLNTVESGLGRIRKNMEEAASSLGYGVFSTFRNIHLPIMKGSLMTALLLVFVDVLKELPATLILRPFNFNTLAVRAFELASDERLADAAAPSLAIVVAGIIPVILLSRSITRSRPGHA